MSGPQSRKASKTHHQLCMVESNGLHLDELPDEILEIILFKSLFIGDIFNMLVALINTCTTFATIVLNFMNKNMKVVKLPLFKYMFPDKKVTQFNLFCNSYSFFIKFSTGKMLDCNMCNRLLTKPYSLFLNKLIEQHCSTFKKQEYNPLTFALKLLNDDVINKNCNNLYILLNKIKLIIECIEPLFSKRNKIYCVFNIVNINLVYKLFTLYSRKYYYDSHTNNYKSIMRFIKYFFEKLFIGTTTTYEELTKYKTLNVNFEGLIKFIPELYIYAEKYAIKFDVKLVMQHLISSTQSYLETNLYKYPIECQIKMFNLNNTLLKYLDKTLQLKILRDPKTDIKKFLKYTRPTVQRQFLSLNGRDDIMIPKWLKFTSPSVQVEEVKIMISNLKYCKLEIQYFFYQRNSLLYKEFISKELKPKLKLTTLKKLEDIRGGYAYLTPLLTV